MFQSTSNEVVGIHVPSANDEQEVKAEIAKTALLSESEKKAKVSFINGIIARGQAADRAGEIPMRATHQIIGYEPDGLPVLKRIKF